jgi:hypothetical protein
MTGAAIRNGLCSPSSWTGNDRRFTIEELDVFYEKGAPKFLAADSLGIAVSP